MSVTPDWIAVDWGTSNLRAWAMATDGTVLDRAASDEGMGTLARDGFAPALERLCAGWDAAPVIACGMVGSRQGWVEAPYAAVPCPPLSTPFATAESARFTVRVIPGVKQAEPADVMRGEETQIAGFLAPRPNWDGVLCLPGTHTKWVHVSAGEIVSFRTCMTGDLFAAVTGHTVLRHSTRTDGWQPEAFDRGVADAMDRPERLLSRMFSLRAEGLLNGLEPDAACARLSGLLIGMELADTRPYWLGQRIAVIGAGPLVRLYLRALAAQAAEAETADADAVTLAGLTAAYRTWKETA